MVEAEDGPNYHKSIDISPNIFICISILGKILVPTSCDNNSIFFRVVKIVRAVVLGWCHIFIKIFIFAYDESIECLKLADDTVTAVTDQLPLYLPSLKDTEKEAIL